MKSWLRARATFRDVKVADDRKVSFLAQHNTTLDCEFIGAEDDINYSLSLTNRYDSCTFAQCSVMRIETFAQSHDIEHRASLL